MDDRFGLSVESWSRKVDCQVPKVPLVDLGRRLKP